MRSHLLLFGIPFALCAHQAQAQLPILDIGMVPLENGQLEVRMRPDAEFSGLFSSLTFTVRWELSSGASLGDFIPATTYMTPGIGPIAPEPIPTECDGYNYAVYFGLGFVPVPGWTADQEFVLGHIIVDNGPATFEIVNDACTGVANANFYVSLNSSDQTGEIYTIATPIPGALDRTNVLTIFPNPSLGSTILTIPDISAEGSVIEVLDALGRTVEGTGSGMIPSGASTYTLDGSNLHPGAYWVRVKGKGASQIIPWVVGKR